PTGAQGRHVAIEDVGGAARTGAASPARLRTLTEVAHCADNVLLDRIMRGGVMVFLGELRLHLVNWRLARAGRDGGYPDPGARRAQLPNGAMYLTIDAAGLSFADSRALGILTGTGRSLKELGGRLVLLRPQETVLRMLTLLGADQVVTIRTSTDTAHMPNDDA